MIPPLYPRFVELQLTIFVLCASQIFLSSKHVPVKEVGHLTRHLTSITSVQENYLASNLQDPSSKHLFSIQQHYNGHDFTDNDHFSDDGKLPPFEEYSKKFKFEDATEQWLYHQANSAKGFMYDFQFEDSQSFEETVDVDQVAFIILGCKKLSHRLRSQLQTWLSFTRHYYFAVDEDIPDLENVVVLDQSYTGGRNTYVSAGERHWHSMLWLMKEKSELLAKLKWIVLLDDDTWMNVPKLLDTLSHYNYKYNIGLGQVFHEFITKKRTFLQGGSGMVLSRTAFTAVTKQLFKPWCRYNKHGDLSLWSCYKVAGTLLVHSDKFHQWSVPYDKLRNSYTIKPQDYLNQISFHYMNNHLVTMKMTCDVAEYWDYPEPNDCKEMRLATDGSFYLKLQQLTSLRYSFFEPGPSSGGVPDQ